MKTNLIKIVDSIPTPTPEQGNHALALTLAFVTGFIFAMLILGY